MKRIGISTSVATTVVVVSTAACRGNAPNHTQGANGDVTVEGSGTWYELKTPSARPADSVGLHDIIIHNAMGSVDSVINGMGTEHKITIYGASADSVTNGGPPHPPQPKIPGPATMH
jgi:hypothetical protein